MTSAPGAQEHHAPPQLWVYKRGQLVLLLHAQPGSFLPTTGPRPADSDPDGWMATCPWGSGQFLSTEWEPRIRMVQRRARDLIEFIELLEHRHYAVDLEPPSKKARPFRSL